MDFQFYHQKWNQEWNVKRIESDAEKCTIVLRSVQALQQRERDVRQRDMAKQEWATFSVCDT